MLQTSMMMKTIDLILGFQSPFTPPASTQLPQSGIGAKALLSGNLQSGKFTSICAGTYLIDKWLQQQEHNCQDADEWHGYGGQLSTSNHLQHAAIVGGWVASGWWMSPSFRSQLPSCNNKRKFPRFQTRPDLEKRIRLNPRRRI